MSIRLLSAVVAVLLIAIIAPAKAQYAYLELDTNYKFYGHCNYNKVMVVDRTPLSESSGQKETLLQKYGRFLMSGVPTDSNELLLVLHDFILSQPGQAQESSMLMSADVFLGRNGRYRLCFQFSAFREMLRARDNPNAMGRVVGELAFKVMDSAAHFKFADDGQSVQDYSYNDAVSYRQNQIKQLAVYHTEAYQEGVYHTVDEFLNQQPDTVHFTQKDGFEVYSQHVIPIVCVRKEDGKRGKAVPRDSIFATCYHGKLYLATHYEMRPISFENNSFYCKLLFQTHSYAPRGTAMIIGGGVLFGVVGIVAAVAIAEASKSARHGKVQLATLPYKCKFDPISKRFIPFKRLPAL